DDGLILPPKIAPHQVVIVPIYKGEEGKKKIDEKVQLIVKNLRNAGIRVKYDNSDNNRPGWKFAEYEKKGVPVRIAIGERDLENNSVEVARRDTKEKQTLSIADLNISIIELLDDIQSSMFKKAKAYRDELITEVNSWEEFTETLEKKGGFLSAHWDGTAETENKIKELTKATIRCIPLERKEEKGICVFSGKPSEGRVLFALAY